MATVLPPRPCDSNPATPGAQSIKDDIEEVSNDGSQAPKRRRMGSGDSSRSCDTSSQELGVTYFSAENLTEYRWPSDGSGEYYMLQEQVSEYLGVTSFKRKYPDLERRDLSHKEKLYLREQNVITETQCTLGENLETWSCCVIRKSLGQSHPNSCFGELGHSLQWGKKYLVSHQLCKFSHLKR
ncbi:unnamed protein product [Coregonus sp. 'balchen']|nr:unnamed protein product [Coregonus sp. 'balchen']